MTITEIESRLGYRLKRHGKRAQVKARAIKLAMMQGDSDRAMQTINKALSGRGVDSTIDAMGDIGIVYIDVGDIFSDTVIFDTRKRKYFISSWAEYVELNNKRFM